MKKLLCVAAIAAMCVVPAMAQTTLNLRIAADKAQAGPDEAVHIQILGELTGDPSEGLALWSTNLTNQGSATADLCDRTNVLLLDAPAGDMQSFARNLGLTNPGPGGSTDATGYSGTCDGAMGLWQIGGGLNTIHNTGPTLYPIAASIPTGVADGAEVVLAEGDLTTPSDFTTGNIILTLDSPFANVITADETGPVYAVEEAQVVLTTASVQIDSGPPPVANVVSAASYGYHAGAVAADLGIPVAVAGTTVEGRQIDAQGTRLYLVVTMDKNMSSGSVTLDPAVAATATADGSADLVITFDAAPSDETCYNVDLAGSQATDGAVEAAGTDFCICYNEADVDGSGTVNTIDDGYITSGLNFFKNADVAANVTADIDRSGVVNTIDDGFVTAGVNFFHSAAACP